MVKMINYINISILDNIGFLDEKNKEEKSI
jgi:hypothetical protein